MSSFRGQVSSESDSVVVPQSCPLSSGRTANEKSNLLKIQPRRETTETGSIGLLPLEMDNPSVKSVKIDG